MISFIFEKILGWKIEGSFNPDIKKSVVIIVPHTSWIDFIIGAFARKIIKVEIDFIAKKELFKGILGSYLRWMGGSPLDRTPGQNKVEAIAKLYQNKEIFRIALAPEGTRKKVEKWKSGYYYIALLAKVPIIPVAFDYGKKIVRIGAPFYPSGNIEKDSRILRLFYKDVKGKN